MEYALQLSMNQLLNVIKTLPVNEKSFLKTCIEKDIAEDKKQSSITQLLLSGPTMSEEQYLSYQQLRKDFRKWSKKRMKKSFQTLQKKHGTIIRQQ